MGEFTDMMLDVANFHETRLHLGNKGKCLLVGIRVSPKNVFDSLPLDTVMLVISELLPKIQNLQAGRQKANTAGAITDFLQSVTLTDVLPPAPALYPRRFLVCGPLR